MTLRVFGGSVVVAVALVAGAGCGGDDGPTPEEFRSEANTICERHTETIERAASEVLGGGQLPSEEEFGRLARETIIPEVRQTFEELRDVEAPAELEDDFDEFVETGEETVETMEEDPSVITNPSNFEELNRQADELGLSRACRVGPG